MRRFIDLMIRLGQDDIQLLDIGSRRSSYTSGIAARVTLMDLPQESDQQKSQDLGASDATVKLVRQTRSNIKDYILGDFTKNELPADTFNIVSAVEVIEHVPDDAAFIREMARVLKPGGVALLTTPNGIAMPNVNPDELRHYSTQEFRKLMADIF